MFEIQRFYAEIQRHGCKNVCLARLSPCIETWRVDRPITIAFTIDIESQYQRREGCRNVPPKRFLVRGSCDVETLISREVDLNAIAT